MYSADGRSPVVFVTYAHDSEKHKDDVRALAEELATRLLAAFRRECR